MMETATITLELALQPEDLPLLLRQPELKAPGKARRQSGRGSKLNLVWHDTPEGTLASDGLALAQCQTAGATTWRLERMVANTTSIWPPGAALAPIAEDPEQPASLPGPLLPVAAFDGTTRALLGEDAGVSVTLLQGELRAVAAARPVCRLIFAGTNAAALAQAWAGKMRLSAPRLSLPAEAFALARRAEPARPLGAPALDAGQTAGEGFAFVLAHLAGVIQHHAPGALAMTGPEPVHQMRVALRRLRSAILLFRRAVSCPALDDANLRLKELGRVLGPPRDWDVFTAGAGRNVGAAFEDDAAVTALLVAAERRRRSGYAELAAYLESPAWRQLGICLATLVLTRPWQSFIPDDLADAVRHEELQRAPLPEFASRALQKRFEAVIEPGPDLSGLALGELHEIRLHAKRLRYAAEFFAPLFPGRITRRFLRRMSALQEHLGQLNDGAVAATLMAELPGRSAQHQYAVGVVRGFVAAHAGGGRRKIEQCWERFLKLDPFWK